MASTRIQAILSLRDNFSSALDKAKESAKGFEKAWKAQGKAIRKTGYEMQRVGEKMTKAFTTPLKAVGTLGAAVAGLGAKTGFAEALDLQGYRQQLNTATKDTIKAAKIMKNAVALANRTPFEAGELVEGAAKFEAMGMSADKWLTLTGDMAAATNKSFDQATEALIDAQTGELERLKEFGITKAMISEKANKMFADQEVVNNKGQIVDQEKFNEAMIALMKDKYAGGMEAQAKTIRGMWSTVTGVTKSALATMLGMTEDGSVRTGSALDIIGQKVGGLAEKFDKWQQDGTIKRWAESFDTAVGNVMAVVGPVFATIGGLLQSFIGWFSGLSDGQQKAFTAIVLVVGALGPLISLLGSAMVAFGRNFQAIMTFVSVLGKIVPVASLVWKGITLIMGILSGPFGLAIAAAVAAGVMLYKNWETIKRIGSSAFKTVTNWVNKAKNAIKYLNIAVIDFVTHSPLGKIGSMVGGAISVVGRKIGHNASGTSYWRGGLTAVHERGGEIIDLPRGTRIYPHDESVRMARQEGARGGGATNVNFSGAVFNVREEADVDKIAARIVKKLQLAEKNRVVMA